MSCSSSNLDARSVLIVGASTRAAAHSAIRAGLAPVCVDLFADVDLRACARVLDVADYPHGLPAAAARAPCCPWFYTGGLENHPGIVNRISRLRPLWGNDRESLCKARDPWFLARLLEDAGLPFCRVWPRDENHPPGGRWMIKPLSGAAGRGIRLCDFGVAPCRWRRKTSYLQEFRAGVAHSALYLALPRVVQLLAITRQLIGLREVHAPPFAWCGTIVPADLSTETVAKIAQIGKVVGAGAALRGLFGCDFLIDREQPWLTEVNPRYPASTELVETYLRVPLIDWHRRACESFAAEDDALIDVAFADSTLAEGNVIGTRPFDRTTLGKIVLYSGRDFAAPDFTKFVWQPESWLSSWEARYAKLPYVADIPHPGQPISRGQPLCTFFARGPNSAECLAKLLRRAALFERIASHPA